MRLSCGRLATVLAAAILAMAAACAGSVNSFTGHSTAYNLTEPLRRDHEPGHRVAPSQFTDDLDVEPTGLRATVAPPGYRNGAVESQPAGAVVIALIAAVAAAWLLGSRW